MSDFGVPKAIGGPLPGSGGGFDPKPINRGKLMRDLRVSMGVNLRDLSEELPLSVVRLSEYERGHADINNDFGRIMFSITAIWGRRGR